MVLSGRLTEMDAPFTSTSYGPSALSRAEMHERRANLLSPAVSSPEMHERRAFLRASVISLPRMIGKRAIGLDLGLTRSRSGSEVDPPFAAEHSISAAEKVSPAENAAKRCGLERRPVLERPWAKRLPSRSRGRPPIRPSAEGHRTNRRSRRSESKRFGSWNRFSLTSPSPPASNPPAPAESRCAGCVPPDTDETHRRATRSRSRCARAS